MAHGTEADFKVVSDRDGPGPPTGRALVAQLVSAPFWHEMPRYAVIAWWNRVALGLPYGISDNDVPIRDIVHQQLSMRLKHKAV